MFTNDEDRTAYLQYAKDIREAADALQAARVAAERFLKLKTEDTKMDMSFAWTEFVETVQSIEARHQ